MKEIISCCGVVCSDCESYPHLCKGCPNVQGKPYWLEYKNLDVCETYECCHQQQLKHCGKCNSVPCQYYYEGDPTKSEEENKRIMQKQLVQLVQLK